MINSWALLLIGQLGVNVGYTILWLHFETPPSP